jgi:hypothetical protein
LGFYSLFYCLRAEMSLRCKQKFPGKEKCLRGQLSPFGDLLQSVLSMSGSKTRVLDLGPKLLEFHMPGSVTCSYKPNKEAW